MPYQIIEKQKTVPTYSHIEIKIKHIGFYPCEKEYEEKDITEMLISQIIDQIPKGIEVRFSLIPYGEDDFLEVICDGKWLALAYCGENGKDIAYSYSADFFHGDFMAMDDLTPLTSGGQSPIPKFFALQDIKIGIEAVRYFVWTGKLYPGIDWAKQLS